MMMKKNRSTQILLYNLAIGILFVLLLQGCTNAVESFLDMRMDTDDYKSGKNRFSVTDVESQMKHTKEHIENLKAEQARLQGMLVLLPHEHYKLTELEKDIEYAESKLIRLGAERREMIAAERGEITSQTGGCFLPDTLVTMADGSMKPFDQIRPGDQVLTYDVGYQRMVGNPVVDVYTVDGNHLYTINGEISTTGTERLLSDTGWKRVRDLQVGDQVHVDGRMVRIVTIDYQWSRHKLYNMQVDESHSFYVATDSGARYLVHNSGGGGK